MVSRKGKAPMTVGDQKQLLRWSTTDKEMTEIVDACKRFARTDEAHNRWYLEMRWGKAKASSHLIPDIGLGSLESTDDCIDAVNTVLAAQQAHTITEEHAESFRKTILAAASLHRSKAADALVGALEEAGSLPFFPPAQREETVQAFTDFFNAQEGKSE